MTKFVYSFDEGNKDMREILGGKGANLAEMTSIGLPVPQGFTVTTEACNKYYDDKETINDEIKVIPHLQVLVYINNEVFDEDIDWYYNINGHKYKYEGKVVSYIYQICTISFLSFSIINPFLVENKRSFQLMKK